MIPARFAAAIKAASEQSPMTNGQMEVAEGRLLLVDGDGLCYYCAGKDDTAAGEARANMLSKIESAKRACGAELVKIVVTGAGSHKGFRYAIARVKPYQGQRDGGRRPKNWEHLRNLLEQNEEINGYQIERTSIAEADDLFARYATHHPDCVIYTQDKDMRMVPGKHLDWLTHILVTVPKDCWSMTANDKLYGRKWFWLQMLMGDTADNVPGLPKYLTTNAKGEAALKPVGEKTAEKLLDEIVTDTGALITLRDLYEGYYGARWAVEMLEQGALLWMRNDQSSSALNVTFPGNPLHALTTHELYPAARAEIMARIAESMVAETQDDGGGGDAQLPADRAEQSVCPVQSAVHGDGGSAGPRSLDGDRATDAASVVQCAAGQDRERVQALRREEPAGVPSWGRLVLAKARNNPQQQPASSDAQVA